MANPFEDLDDYRFMMPMIINLETEQAEALAKFFIREIEPTSVIDVGCGPGNYLSPYINSGIVDVLGIDACETAGQLIPGRFERVDLRFPWKPQKRFDLALCIEVAEHLKPEFSFTLMKTLSECSDVLYLTAAFPGQNGSFHYCERPKEYWLNMLYSLGYRYHPKNDLLQEHLHEDKAYDKVKFLQWNSMLLVRGE